MLPRTDRQAARRTGSAPGSWPSWATVPTRCPESHRRASRNLRSSLGSLLRCFGVEEAAAVGNRAAGMVGPLSVARLAAVRDQIYVGLENALVGELRLQVVVGLLRRRLRRHQADSLGYAFDVPIDGHERHAEREEEHD